MVEEDHECNGLIFSNHENQLSTYICPIIFYNQFVKLSKFAQDLIPKVNEESNLNNPFRTVGTHSPQQCAYKSHIQFETPVQYDENAEVDPTDDNV